jgi:hypothetical protein
MLKLDEIKIECKYDPSMHDLMLSINGIDAICIDGVNGQFFSVFIEKDEAKELRRLGFKLRDGEKICHNAIRGVKNKTVKAKMLDMEGHPD